MADIKYVLPRFLTQNTGTPYVIYFLCSALLLINIFAVQNFLYAEDFEDDIGDFAISEKYLEWALNAEKEGSLEKAEAAILRAMDYEDASSDLSYYFAVLRTRLHRNRNEILFCLNKAIETDRWKKFDLNAAYILKTETLISLTDYDAAVRTATFIKESEKKNELLLEIYFLSKNNIAFRKTAFDAIEKYPYDTKIAELIFKYAASIKEPLAEDLDLLDKMLKRLHSLLGSDPTLVYRAAPFIFDTADARRLLEEYRATEPYIKEALPALLNIGVIDEDTAIEELFSTSVKSFDFYDAPSGGIDKKLLEDVFNLLRTEDTRARFKNNLVKYSGVISEDANEDGICEASALYTNGILQLYNNDYNQNGEAGLAITFKGGVPISAEFFDTNNPYIVNYDVYPAVKKVSYFKNDVYFFRPEDFYYSPIVFENLCGSVLFPERDELELSERTLISFSYMMEKPSDEFAGAVKRLRLSDGVILFDEEILNGKIVSKTEYKNGKPFLQKVDTDLDGSIETIRHFNDNGEIEYIESDWDGDGTYE
jgi:antitoxin component YwqK of YwqJK toxin-antitoxin module